MEERQLLVAVHRIAGVVDVEGDGRGRSREEAAEEIDERRRHARHIEALELIGGLHANEEMIRRKKLSGAAKLAWRRENSVPIVEAFWRWCRSIVEDLS